jgi:O-6-methylguanine DNA methyltransferase
VAGYPAIVRVAYHMMNSPVGLLFVARTSKGLRYCQYMDRKSLKRMISSHEAELPDATWEPSLLELKSVTEQLESYFNGGLVEFEMPLDRDGSEFQLKVWAALEKIPYGETRTYGQIATAIEQPRATRAVGLANNQNPIAIVVPCHRVIGADGSLTGYGGGMPKKRWLLEHEASHAKRLGLQGELFVATGQEGRRARR